MILKIMITINLLASSLSFAAAERITIDGLTSERLLVLKDTVEADPDQDIRDQLIPWFFTAAATGKAMRSAYDYKGFKGVAATAGLAVATRVSSYYVKNYISRYLKRRQLMTSNKATKRALYELERLTTLLGDYFVPMFMLSVSENIDYSMWDRTLSTSNVFTNVLKGDGAKKGAAAKGVVGGLAISVAQRALFLGGSRLTRGSIEREMSNDTEHDYTLSEFFLGGEVFAYMCSNRDDYEEPTQKTIYGIVEWGNQQGLKTCASISKALKNVKEIALTNSGLMDLRPIKDIRAEKFDLEGTVPTRIYDLVSAYGPWNIKELTINSSLIPADEWKQFKSKLDSGKSVQTIKIIDTSAKN